jgi:hypothetical protein
VVSAKFSTVTLFSAAANAAASVKYEIAACEGAATAIPSATMLAEINLFIIKAPKMKETKLCYGHVSANSGPGICIPL